MQLWRKVLKTPCLSCTDISHFCHLPHSGNTRWNQTSFLSEYSEKQFPTVDEVWKNVWSWVLAINSKENMLRRLKRKFTGQVWAGRREQLWGSPRWPSLNIKWRGLTYWSKGNVWSSSPGGHPSLWKRNSGNLMESTECWLVFQCKCSCCMVRYILLQVP